MSGWSVIAGLGNPGREYERTRHNIGFMVLDALAERLRVSAWKEKMGALQAPAEFAGAKVVLVKPQRYMNLSGGPVSQVLSFYKCGKEDLLVVHDEVDLPFGALRVKSGSGDGGHNGVKSISQSLSTKDYVRLRCGVGRPNVPPEAAQKGISSWVLGGFSAEEARALPEFLDRCIAALECFYREGITTAQNRFNT